MSQVPVVPGDASNQDIINAANNAIRELNNRDNVILYKDDSGTRRVILDKDGLRTSSEGVDVYGASNSDLTFNSNNNLFKIITSATKAVTVPNPAVASTTYTSTVAHNLGFTPAFLCFVTTPSSLSSIISGAGSQIYGTPFNLPTSVGTSDRPITAQVRADSSNIYFDVINYQTTNINNMDGDWVFRYYLLQETAN